MMQRGNNLDSYSQLVGVQQRRLISAFRSAQRDVIKIRGQSRETEIHSPNSGLTTCRRIGLLGDLAECEALKRGTLEVEISSNDNHDDQHRQCEYRPADSPLPCHMHIKKPARL